MPAYDSEGFSPPAPVARVTVRNPETGATLTDLPLLIDSGADVTLLPTSAVESLGIAVSEGTNYELLGFDGNTSISAAVRADLIFLIKTFKGQFLLINQEIGILGRDVLNHTSFLLDGPSLNWEERRNVGSFWSIAG